MIVGVALLVGGPWIGKDVHSPGAALAILATMLLGFVVFLAGFRANRTPGGLRIVESASGLPLSSTLIRVQGASDAVLDALPRRV